MNCPNCRNSIQGTSVQKYHYKECGLNNVYFIDIVQKYQCSCGETYYEFPHVNIIYLVIAYQILKKHSLLTKEEFRFLRKWVGLTAEKLITLLGVRSRVTVSNWERGIKPISQATDHAMRMVVMGLKDKEIRQRMAVEIKFEDWLNNIKPVVKPVKKINVDSEKIEEFTPSSPVVPA
jgi:DNA-binding transcriptional regulator YiaG